MDKIASIDDINNITEGDLRDMFDDIDLSDTNKNIHEEKKDICPNCNISDHIIEDHSQGILVCDNCGQVIDYVMDANPEWRAYEDDKGGNDNGRCSQPINKLLPQSSLGTSIGGGAWRSRLKTLHSWSAMPYKERSLNTVFKEIHARCAKANIVKCIEDDAKIMYKSISESKHVVGKNKGKYIIIRGANRRSLIAACVFYACKKKGMTRSPKEISDLFDLKYTEITRGCKNFIKMIKIRKLNMTIGTTQPEHFIIRFCNELKIKKEYVSEALTIAKNIKRLNIASDHTPFSIATGSILLMASRNEIPSITKRRLSNKFGVSEVTITKAYNKLRGYLDILCNDTKTNQIIELIKQKNPYDVIPDTIKARLKYFGITDKDMEQHNFNIENKKNNISGMVDNEIDHEIDSDLEIIDDDEYDASDDDKKITTMDKIYYDLMIAANKTERLHEKYKKLINDIKKAH